MKRTKILATFGPAIDSSAKLGKLIKTGVNAFRVNCSHGDTAYFKRAAALIRRVSRHSRWPIGLLFDISGPKLRLADFEGELVVKQRDKIKLTTGRTDLEAGLIAVNHPVIIKSVKMGERVFVDDGNLQFKVDKTDRQHVTLTALNDGKLLPRKGVNLPDSDLNLPAITAKDRADIKTAVEANADYIALSFVRSVKDIETARRILKKLGGRQKIIAKLEKREAVEALDDLVEAADGFMIARGDLGVELPPAEVPKLQKRIIRLANRHHKPVIVATQMLESMRFAPRATRAEINDVASAVFDLSDAVMLSAETATGQYPEAAVATMRDVIETTEVDCPVDTRAAVYENVSPIPYSIARAVSNSGRDCQAGVIFAFTTSGYTAGLISNLFPPQPIIALTQDERVARQLTLYRSVYAIVLKQPKSFDEIIAAINGVARKRKLARKGDRVVVTGGVPFGTTAPTNFMLFHEVP